MSLELVYTELSLKLYVLLRQPFFGVSLRRVNLPLIEQGNHNPRGFDFGPRHPMVVNLKPALIGALNAEDALNYYAG